MTKNMGRTDRILRILVAIVLIALGVSGTLQGGWAVGGYIVAGIFIGTSFVSFCPLYRIAGMNTCENK